MANIPLLRPILSRLSRVQESTLVTKKKIHCWNMWWICITKEGQAWSATLVKWDCFYFQNIKQSRYSFLLRWKRSNQLSRGHISHFTIYNRSHHTLFCQVFLIHVTLVWNGMMLTRFINQYWPKPTCTWIYHRTQLTQVENWMQ